MSLKQKSPKLSPCKRVDVAPGRTKYPLKNTKSNPIDQKYKIQNRQHFAQEKEQNNLTKKRGKGRYAKSGQHGQRASAIFFTSCAKFWAAYVQNWLYVESSTN